MRKKCSIRVKRSATVWEKPYQPCLVATVLYAESNMHCLLKEQGNTCKTKFNAIESGKMCKSRTITTYWKSSEIVRKTTHCLLKKLWEQMEKKHNHSSLNKQSKYDLYDLYWPIYYFVNDNICKIASIAQWSPAVCGKPILFHFERAVRRNLNRSTDCDAIAYWESNDSSTKHILFLRNGW